RCVDEGRVADEAAEARSAGHQDDGLVAAYVDGPDGIAIVQDVRWMAAGDAPARARPLPLVRLQAHAHAIGVAVDLPGVAEEEVHVGGRQVVGIGLGTAHGLDLPVARVGGAQARPQATADQPVDAVAATERDPVTLLEARRVRAEGEVAYPAREVLYGRLDAAFENLEHHPPPPLWNRYVLDGLSLAPLERRHRVFHRVEEAAVGLDIERFVLHDLVPIGAVVDTRTNRLQLVVRHAHPLDAIGGLQEDRVRLERGVPLLEVEDRDGAPEELVT